MTGIEGEARWGSPGGSLRFQVLGPLAVRAGETWLRLGGPGQRSLLAVLLLRANQVVSSERLLEAIWGESPPRTASAKLQAHVSALRRMLGDPFDRKSSHQLLVTRPPGYLIHIEPEQLDISMFEAHAEEGRRLLADEPARAADELRAALSLWRGRPLDGIDLGGAFAFEATQLEERHFAVLEQRIEADFRLGRHAELIGELESLAFAHPLRERLHGQLMLALYRDGRRAEALDAYRRAQRQLAQELGLDPGRDLQTLEHAILTGDPALEVPPASRPHWSLPRLAERVVDERHRLDELSAGDAVDKDARARLTSSYRALEAREQHAFRLAGLLPAPDFATWTVAALLDVDMPTAEDLLERLVGARLLEAAAVDAHGQARYPFHGLPRELARERALDEESAAERYAAERRVIAAYLALAELAETSVPGLRGLGTAYQEPDRQRAGAQPSEAARRSALAWFGVERQGITAAVSRACELGLDQVACRLAAAVSPYFSLRGQYDDWRRTQEQAAMAAAQAGNDHGEAFGRCWLGHYHIDRGDPIAAERQFERSLALFSELGDRRGEAHALHGLGSALHGRGKLTDAQRCLETSLRTFEGLGDRQGEAWALFNLGACKMDRADGCGAAELLRRSIELFDAIGDPLGKAYAMRTLGNADLRLGNLEQAVSGLQSALGLFAGLADQQGQALAVLSLGMTYRKMRHVDSAAVCLQSALGAFNEFGARFRVGVALHELGQLHQEQGQAEEALRCYRNGLTAFREVGVRVWEARTLRKIGEILPPGEAVAAHATWLEALTIFRELGAPEADDMTVSLTATSLAPGPPDRGGLGA